MDKATFEKGLQIRKDTLGAEFVENAFNTRGRLQPADAGAGDRVLLGLRLGTRGAVEEDAQHAEPGDDQRAQPAARAEDARQGRAA